MQLTWLHMEVCHVAHCWVLQGRIVSIFVRMLHLCSSVSIPDLESTQPTARVWMPPSHFLEHYKGEITFKLLKKIKPCD